MENRETLVAEIIYLEYQLFSDVHHVTGRASCQDKKNTFEKMRRAQFSVWSKESLKSWERDLRQSIFEGRNIFTEKYAYMMKDSDPLYYDEIKSELPAIGVEKEHLVNSYVQFYFKWLKESLNKYPNFRKRGRSPRANTSNQEATSFETYLKGEAKTYSVDTLRHLISDCSEAEELGENLLIQIDENLLSSYGYASIECFEEGLKNV